MRKNKTRWPIILVLVATAVTAVTSGEEIEFCFGPECEGGVVPMPISTPVVVGPSGDVNFSFDLEMKVEFFPGNPVVFLRTVDSTGISVLEVTATSGFDGVGNLAVTYQMSSNLYGELFLGPVPEDSESIEVSRSVRGSRGTITVVREGSSVYATGMVPLAGDPVVIDQGWLEPWGESTGFVTMTRVEF